MIFKTIDNKVYCSGFYRGEKDTQWEFYERCDTEKDAQQRTMYLLWVEVKKLINRNYLVRSWE
jgi:hypothetical protein